MSFITVLQIESSEANSWRHLRPMASAMPVCRLPT